MWWISYDDIGHFIPVVFIAEYAVELITVLAEVRAEKDRENMPAAEEHPHIYRAEYAKLRTNEFISQLIHPYRSHLGMHCFLTKIDAIERNHKKLVTAFKTDLLSRESLKRIS